MSAEPCPRCGKPIPDTAYVCTACQTELASKLRHGAALWEHVQDTVGHLARVGGTSPIRAPRRNVIGPECEGRRCDHESCVAIWKSTSRLRNEPAGVREEKGLLDLDALENSWVVANTVDAWASHVSDRRGTSPKLRMPPIGAQQLRTIPDHPERCVYSDLPIEQCACGRPHQAAS